MKVLRARIVSYLHFRMVRSGWPVRVASGRQEEAPATVQAQWCGGGMDAEEEGEEMSKMPRPEWKRSKFVGDQARSVCTCDV